MVRALCHSLKTPAIHLSHEGSILGVSKVLWNNLFFKLKHKEEKREIRVMIVLSKQQRIADERYLPPLALTPSKNVRAATK
jgi:hypothetical protein